MRRSFYRDLNIKNLKPEIDNNTKCQKNTITHLVALFLEKSIITYDPESIYLHVGTNDLDRLDVELFIANFKEISSKLKEISLRLMWHPKYRNIVEDNLISAFVDETRKMNFVSNISLRVDMLVDTKYLSREGFSILLGLIRFILLGKLPKKYRCVSQKNDDRFASRNNAETNNNFWNNL